MADPATPPSAALRRARWDRELRARLASLRLSPAREAEIVEELAQDLDDHWRELVAGGARDDEATRLALAQFRTGNVLAQYMAPLRQSNVPQPAVPGISTGRLVSDFGHDLRYALRVFWRQPAFAIAAIVTLALGIGASSAIFSVVHGVLLEPLPFSDADRLYRLRMVYPDAAAYSTFSAPDFVSVREDTRVFDRVEAYTSGAVTMLGGGEPREVRVASVSDGLFELLGLPVDAGRTFRPDENTPGRNGVAILDHGFWQRAFGGDKDAIGRAISLGGASYSIVGVLRQGARLPADVPGARVPSEADVYLPIEYGASFSATAATQRRSNYLAVVARARTDVSAANVDEDLRRIAARLQAAFPQSNAGLSMNAISLQELIVGDVRRPLLVLLGAVAFVLLVACANVASLMLARASARREEFTVRAAIGAGRARLVRQLLTEALVLGLAGGALGLGLAFAGTQALVAAQPTDIPRLDEIGLNRSVMLFTFAVALLASLVFGAVPALQATGHVARGLRAGSRGGGADRQTRRVRAALVVIEVALAVVLLVGAGLLLRSLDALTQVRPGFVAEEVMAFRVALFGRGYDPQRVRGWVHDAAAELGGLPGVTAVAATSVLPLNGPGPRQAFRVEDAPPPPANVNREIGVVSVTPGYFATIGAPMLRGRDFATGDQGDAPRVAIVNEAAVRRWFPDGRAIGRRVDASGGVREIVGVIADVQQGDPRIEVAPQLFVPYAQSTSRFVWIAIRTTGNPLALAPAVTAAVHRLDANLAISGLTSLDEIRTGVTARPRFYSSLLALFAAVALGLVVTGIFAVMSHTVAERTREIGIRMALGACAPDVLRMIVGRSLMLAVTGVATGLAVALALGRLIQNQLFGVELLDPLTLGAVVLILLTSAAAASFLPARRAARLDPTHALRRG